MSSPPAVTVTHNPATAGMVIGIATILTIVFVAHHPVAAGHQQAEILSDIVLKTSADRLVHGGLIAIMGMLLFGFSLFACRLGAARPLVLLGLIAYAVGCASTIGAAIIDGFVVPDIAARFLAAPADARTAFDFLAVAGSAIKHLTQLGLTMLSVGILSWSAILVRSRGPGRWIGLLGLAAGGIPALVILGMGPVMTPHSLIAILATQGIWNLAVAVLLTLRARDPLSS